ncbi:MAG: hypothetical protein ROO71_01635 [Balneola sp.]
MNKEEKEMNSLLGKGSDYGLELKKNKQFKSFSLQNELTPVNGLQILSAFIQILLGTLVVTVSILELIYPIWLGTVLSVFGCISIISGLAFSYSVFSNSKNFNSLVNEAIKRVITFQN